MPKRKFEEVERSEPGASQQDDRDQQPDDDSSQSCSSVSCGGDGPVRKKQRKSVIFDNVDVFYFPRVQGFTCVPSQGGAALGMGEKHMHQEQYSLKHYRKLRKLVRRKKANATESAENSFGLDSILEVSNDELAKTDSEEDDTEMDGFFLQPVPMRLRRSLLKSSGVRKLDTREKDECKELRGSREQCGCSCEGVCEPATCLCIQNEIQCQVDRFSFPCGCTAQGCQNPSGRIEFNPAKVRKHYVHTLKRLKTEASNSPLREHRMAGRHIRFSDEGEPFEGEDSSFNSTEKGTCLDCHMPGQSTEKVFTLSSETNSFRRSASSRSLDSYQLISRLDGDSDYTDFHGNPLTLDTFHTSDFSPISGMLNPIIGTGLSSPSSRDSSWHASLSDNAVSDWHTLSHESMLNSSQLMPVDSKSDATTSSDSHSDLLFLSSFQSVTSRMSEVHSRSSQSEGSVLLKPPLAVEGSVTESLTGAQFSQAFLSEMSISA